MAEILKMKQKRYRFNVIHEKIRIENLIGWPLPDDTVVKLISDGGFSSISFIRYVAEHTHINHLYASTLRVGRKHLECLDVMHRQGMLGGCTLIVGSIMKQDSEYVKKYKYYDDLTEVCEKNGWEVIVEQNHSKVILFDTEDGYFVLETSSNLNENPKREQFSFEKSEELFNFYLQIFQEGVNDGRV